MYGCVYVCVCMWVCVVCCRAENMPLAMTSGEGHFARGFSTSMPKRDSADHHGNGWSATGCLGGACVGVWVYGCVGVGVMCMCVCVRVCLCVCGCVCG